MQTTLADMLNPIWWTEDRMLFGVMGVLFFLMAVRSVFGRD